MNLNGKILGLLFIAAMMLAVGCKKEDEVITSITDVQGNSYKVVKIDRMWWMAENLKATKSKSGTTFKEIDYMHFTDWNGNTACCCYYGGNSSYQYYVKMGRLYNGPAMKTNPCPDGWHVPTSKEWNSMIEFLGGANVAGGKLKSTENQNYWKDNVGASDEVGFNGLGSGYVMDDGSSSLYRLMAGYWSSDMKVFELQNSTAKIVTETGRNINGYSIRCVKEVETK